MSRPADPSAKILHFPRRYSDDLTGVATDEVCSRFKWDELAQLLAEADDQSWGALASDERERYRTMAWAVAEKLMLNSLNRFWMRLREGDA